MLRISRNWNQTQLFAHHFSIALFTLCFGNQFIENNSHICCVQSSGISIELMLIGFKLCFFGSFEKIPSTYLMGKTIIYPQSSDFISTVGGWKCERRK